MKRELLIPEIIAKKAIRERSVVRWRFRNACAYAMDGGLALRDKGIHERKNTHGRCGTLPAYLDVCWAWYIKCRGLSERECLTLRKKREWVPPPYQLPYSLCFY
jgi:hypothetical protein